MHFQHFIIFLELFPNREEEKIITFAKKIQ